MSECMYWKEGKCVLSDEQKKVCSGNDEEIKKCIDAKDFSYDKLLWDILKEHWGHRVEIAVYGDPSDPASVTLEDLETNEVILDAGLNTLCSRED